MKGNMFKDGQKGWGALEGEGMDAQKGSPAGQGKGQNALKGPEGKGKGKVNLTLDLENWSEKDLEEKEKWQNQELHHVQLCTRFFKIERPYHCWCQNEPDQCNYAHCLSDVKLPNEGLDAKWKLIFQRGNVDRYSSVSYTHLTLPTNREV